MVNGQWVDVGSMSASVQSGIRYSMRTREGSAVYNGALTCTLCVYVYAYAYVYACVLGASAQGGR